MDPKLLTLDGRSLTTENLYYYTINPKTKIKIYSKCFININRARLFLEKEMNRKVIYGVNTGF